MKNWIAAILALVFLMMPAQAEAAPLTAFVGGLLNALGAGTFLTSGAVGAWSAGFAVGSFLGGTFIGNLLLSVGLQFAQAAIRGKPDVPSPSDRMVNYSQPIMQQERGYGRVRKGGPFALSAHKANRRHYGIIIAAHSTKGPVAHWLDKTEVEVDAGGAITTAPMAGYGSIRTYTGQPDQVADAEWVSVFDEITAADDFAGLSYAALWAQRPPDNLFSKIYISGVQWAYAPVWDMHDQVYDPRDQVKKWTQNAALIIAAEAVYFGKDVDWDEVAAQADICDQLVPNQEGGTQRRWTINGVFDDGQTWETVRSQLAIAADVFFYERPDGKVGFKVGAWVAPSVVITDRDVLSITIADAAWGPDAPNEFSVRYVEPARDYVETPCGAVVVDGGGVRLEEQAFLIDSHNQAARVSARIKARSRPDLQIKGVVKFIGYDLIGQRFFRYQSDETGHDLFVEIEKLSRNGDGITFSFEGVSTGPDAFPDDVTFQEPVRPVYEVIEGDDDVVAPQSLTGAVIQGTGGAALIEWSWPPLDLSLRPELRIRSIEAGVTDWQVITLTSGATSYVASGLVDGALYEAQLRSRTAANRVSDYVPLAPATVRALADTAAPAALVAFDAQTVAGDVQITFTAPASSNYSGTVIYRSDTNDVNDAVLIREEFGLPNQADEYFDTGLAAGDYSYWAAPRNASGILGPLSGPETVTLL